MKKNHCFFSICLLAGLAACTDNMDIPDVPDKDDNDVIGFTWVTEGPESRTVQEKKGSSFSVWNEDVDSLFVETIYTCPDTHSRAAEKQYIAEYGAFSVTARRTDGTDADIYINRQNVNVKADGWCTMDRVYPWPGEDYTLDFVAVAPVNADGLVWDSSVQGLYDMVYTAPADMKMMQDVIVAVNEGINGADNGAVEMAFRHICASVNVRLADGMTDWVLEKVTFKNVYATGRYDAAAGVWSEKTDKRDFTGTADDLSGQFCFLMVPQEMTDKAELEVSLYNKVTHKTVTCRTAVKDTWFAGERLLFKLNVKPDYTLEFITESELQDAHYVICPVTFRMQGMTGSYTVGVDGNGWATVTDKLTDLQEQGFWVADDRGGSSVTGTAADGTYTAYLFLEENMTGAERSVTVSLAPQGVTEAARTLTITQLPAAMDGGVAVERFEDDFGKLRDIEEPLYPFGFKWDRVVTYTNRDFLWRLILHWSAQDAIEDNGASSFVTSTYKLLQSTTVVINYTKLSALGDVAASQTDGLGNSTALAEYKGVASISEMETVFDSWGMDRSVTGGEAVTVKNFAAKVALMKNRFTKEVKTEENNGTTVTYEVPVLNEADRKWYLPAIGQFASMADADYPMTGSYWSSTAYNDNVNAYSYTVGAGSGKTDRMESLKIRCVRVAD